MSTTQPRTNENLRQAHDALDQLAELEADPQADAAEHLARVEREVVQAEYDDAARNRARIKAGMKADSARDYRALRERLIQRADEKAANAAAIARRDAPDWDTYWKLSGEATHNLVVAGRLEGRERELRKGAYVVHESGPYSPSSPNSWAADLFTVTDPTMTGLPSERVTEAEQRLAKHAQDVAEASKMPSPWGKHVRGVFRDKTRRDDSALHRRLAGDAEKELRATGTGGGITATASTQAAAFVPPYFVLEAWAPFRGEGRPFAEQTKKLPLPPFGMQLYVPFWSSVDKVAKQTEGSAITEASPSAELEGSGTVATLAGVVQLTQQLSDRGFHGGGSFDTEFGKELGERLDREVEKEVFARAIEQGEQITGESSYSNKGLYKDLALAREKLTDTAGTRLRPTHLFTTSDQYFFSSRQVDATTERPLWQPWFAPGFPLARGSDSFDGEPDPQWARFTGTVLPDGMLWFTSEMVPADGTTTKTKLIVSAPEVAICLFEGTPTYEVLPQQFANELKVVARLRNYVGIVTRHKAGTSYVNNCGAYVTTNV